MLPEYMGSPHLLYGVCASQNFCVLYFGLAPFAIALSFLLRLMSSVYLFGVTFGITCGITFGVTFGITFGITFGVTFGVTFGITFGITFGSQ